MTYYLFFTKEARWQYCNYRLIISVRESPLQSEKHTLGGIGPEHLTDLPQVTPKISETAA